MSSPLLYVILGTIDSGRRPLLADLIEGGLAEEDRAFVLLSKNEVPSATDKQLGQIATLGRWDWHEEKDHAHSITAELGGEYTHIFFVTDGRLNPVDQLEALRVWLLANKLELARIITVVNCALASKHHALLAWYDACIHFTDYTLLNRREGVENKWISDFLNRYKALHYPSLFELVKNDRVKNPALVLLPEPRRMSLFFDPDENISFEVDPDTIIETEDGEEIPPSDVEDEEGVLHDPYIERIAPGRRAKEIPVITRYLDKKND